MTLEPYDGPVASALIADLMSDLSARYGGEGDGTPVSPEQFAPPHGAFLVLWRDGRPAACGAWRRDPEGWGELKRMWVGLDFRRQGLARRILAAIEDDARAAGVERVRLETGTAQPEAIALYESSGYVRVADFGHYRCSPTSRSYGKALVPGIPLS